MEVWEIIAIVVTALLVLVILYIGGLRLGFTFVPVPSGESNFVLNFFKILYYFLPYSLFMFGIINDAYTEKIQFFPGSFIALLAVMLNGLLFKAVGIEDSDMCGIPGLSKAASFFVPQNVLFVSTILNYIAGTLQVSYPNISWMFWIVPIIVNALQVGGMFSQGCKFDQYTMFGKLAPVVGYLIGLGIGGGSGYAIASSLSTGINEGVKPLGSTGPVTSPLGSSNDRCSAPNEDDEIICEA